MTRVSSTPGTITESEIAELTEELQFTSREEIIALLAEANTRASEAEQFLNYASPDQVALHRRRVEVSQRTRGPFQDHRQAVPMPRIENGRSVWDPPPGLLTGAEALRLPVGSRVQWVGDSREGGLRRRTSDGWWPMLSETDFYWLIWRPAR